MSDWTTTKNYPDLTDEVFREIKGFYKSRLQIPEVKPKKQFLLCPVGVVASGKTTVIKPLAEKLNAVRVSTDEIRQILKERHYNYNRARDMAYEIVKELLDQGYSVGMDANCGSRDRQEKIKEIEKRPEIKVIWIRINPPEEFIIQKLKKFKHNWLFKDSDEAIYSFRKSKEKYGDFSNLSLPYVYEFDTSKENLNEQISEAVEIIKNKLTL